VMIRHASSISHTHSHFDITQFLDEADLLADNIAVLAIPGRLVAEGSPVALKRDLGSGYTLQVAYAPGSTSDVDWVAPNNDLLQHIRTIAPAAIITESAPHKASFQLNSKDSATVEKILRLIDSERGKYSLVSCDVHGTSIEEIFLDLMYQSDQPPTSERVPLPNSSSAVLATLPEMEDGRQKIPLSQAHSIFHQSDQPPTSEKVSLPDSSLAVPATLPEMEDGRQKTPLSQAHTISHQSDQPSTSEKVSLPNSLSAVPAALTEMKDGRGRTPLSQALTIFHKRALIARRSWLAPLLMVVIVVTGACVPIIFMVGRVQSCTRMLIEPSYVPLFLPDYLLQEILGAGEGTPLPMVLTSPPNITSILGLAGQSLPVLNIADNATFVSTIDTTYRTQPLGGISIDLQTGDSLVAWEATPPGYIGPAMLNLATNILYNYAQNSTNNNITFIRPGYESFPYPHAGTLFALKWAGFFGLAMVSVRYIGLFCHSYPHPVCIPCLLHIVCGQGTPFIYSGHAVLEWTVKPW
jgi:ATP-binding cassette, subfamily A (ABC1), member 3